MTASHRAVSIYREEMVASHDRQGGYRIAKAVSHRAMIAYREEMAAYRRAVTTSRVMSTNSHPGSGIPGNEVLNCVAAHNGVDCARRVKIQVLKTWASDVLQKVHRNTPYPRRLFNHHFPGEIRTLANVR